MKAWPCLALAFTVVTLLAVPAGSAYLAKSPQGKVAFVRFSDEIGHPQIYVGQEDGNRVRVPEPR